MSIEETVQAARTPEGSGVRRVGIAMNGVTGRMGHNQHLVRSILAIRAQGGVPHGREVIWPEPVLIGRDERKLARLAAEHGLERFTTDLDAALADPGLGVYFDAQVTPQRPDAVRRAIAAGKDVYCEKPVTETLAEGLELARLARDAGVRNGVVQDKLFLPGLIKLRELIDTGFFGRILSVRGEFGYWVFPGPIPKPQRPSWNYRKEDDGGIIVDMLCHWRYVLDNLFGGVQSVMCLGATHIPRRVDEDGKAYDATADDAAYAVLEFASGAFASVNSSWAVRVNRRELLELQVDGTAGSAVSGLRDCAVQHRVSTPLPVWNPDLPDPIEYQALWSDVPDNMAFDNGFKVEWELFLTCASEGRPFAWDLVEGAKGVQLANLALRSSAEGRRLEVPPLAV